QAVDVPGEDASVCQFVHDRALMFAPAQVASPDAAQDRLQPVFEVLLRVAAGKSRRMLDQRGRLLGLPQSYADKSLALDLTARQLPEYGGESEQQQGVEGMDGLNGGAATLEQPHRDCPEAAGA